MRELRVVCVRALRDDRRALAVWSLANVLLIGLLVAFWPSIRDSASYTEGFEDLPEAVRSATGIADLGSAAGYLHGQLFSTMTPLLLLSFAIGRGARAIASDESRGGLDLVLSTPVRRRDVVLGRGLALALELGVLGVGTWLTLALTGPLVDLEVPVSRLAAATAGGVALALLYGGMALGLGAATGQRGVSLAAAAGLAGAGFLYTSIAPFVDLLSGALEISPFQLAYGTEPVRTGWHVVDLVVLLVAALLLVVAGTLRFERRDVH